MSQNDQLETTIAYLETQREILGNLVVDAVLAPLRKELKARTIDLADRRKQVTVLFADISNFTAMSEFMDAEDVRHIVEMLWTRIDKVIMEHGGTIDKHIGDAVMALWGIEQTREDDPERAVHAALDMRDAVDDWRADMRHIAPAVAAQDPPVSVRIGINTGSVILGLVGTTGEFTAIGDTVNTASRLEKAAPLGNILISQSTFLHVRGLFELREREPLKVKGKSRTLSTYLVQDTRPHEFRSAQRGIEGITTPMIGRAQAFTFLQDRFFEVLLENHPQFVTLTGDAGIGKSRLIYEFNSWMDSQSWRTSYFMGRARQPSSRMPYGLLRTLIANRLDLVESDPPETVQNKLELGFFNDWEPHPELQKKIHYIARLANFNLTQSRFFDEEALENDEWKAEAAGYAVEYFQAVSLVEPTVILIEDLQWADQETLEILMDTAETASNQILMIISTARHSLRTDMDRWLQQKPTYTQYTLAPLSDGESQELIESILHKVEEIPEALFQLIISQAGGNPYHIEEFIRMLVREQAIIKGNQEWTVEPERLASSKVPTTLASILEARLEAMPSGAQRLFQYAAVIGDVFWQDALAYMNQRITPPIEVDVSAALAYLINAGLICESAQSTRQGTKEYTFTNGFLKQVCYERILKRDRGIYADAAREWFRLQGLHDGDLVESPLAHSVDAGLVHTAQATDPELPV